jgi:hypothetical protein
VLYSQNQTTGRAHGSEVVGRPCRWLGGLPCSGKHGPRVVHSQLITCLQSSAKLSSTVHGLARTVFKGPPEYGNVQTRWCRLWVSSRSADDLLIRRLGQVVQNRPGAAIVWADVSGLSHLVGSWPWSWQQVWQQSRRRQHGRRFPGGRGRLVRSQRWLGCVQLKDGDIGSLW